MVFGSRTCRALASAAVTLLKCSFPADLQRFDSLNSAIYSEGIGQRFPSLGYQRSRCKSPANPQALFRADVEFTTCRFKQSRS